MKNIFVIECIPTTSLNINMFHHLRYFDLVNPFHETVDILIGQDYGSSFLLLEVCRGTKDEPYTQFSYFTRIVNYVVIMNK